VIIPGIQIGAIEFENIGAVVIDYNKTFELSCYNFQGIIGANLMSKLFWKIDYENLEISFTDDVTALQIPKEAQKIPFILKGSQKTPEVSVQINQTQAKHLTFDTGATGSFSLKKSIFNKEIESYPKIISFGTTSVGVYGSGKPSESVYAKIDLLKFGDISLYDQIIEFDESSDLIGNKFLKHYDIFLDWKSKQIFLKENTPFQDSIIQDFGFKLRTIENKLIVSSIIIGSSAEQAGLQLNDQIIRIDDINYDMVSNEDACSMLFNKLLKDKEVINIDVRREGESINMELRRETLLK
jgi:hypothetical protein